MLAVSVAFRIDLRYTPHDTCPSRMPQGTAGAGVETLVAPGRCAGAMILRSIAWASRGDAQLCRIPGMVQQG